MPTIEVTTKSSEKVWSTPDGKMSIYKVTLDYQGKPVSAKTYSDAISREGWHGTVESYEKEGRNGSETFVKQPQKEGFQGGGSSGRQAYGGGKAKDVDPFTMYLSYAKDVLVGMLGTKEGYDEAKYGELLAAVATGGNVLFEGRPGAESAKPSEAEVEQAKDEELQDLSKVLGETLPLAGEDDPWHPKS